MRIKKFKTQSLKLKFSQLCKLQSKMFISLVFLCLFQGTTSRPSEEERVRLWYEKGNTWPPNWQPETPEFSAVMTAREKELMTLTGADERWENWMQYTSSRLLPRLPLF
jgi:hypothetical protein